MCCLPYDTCQRVVISRLPRMWLEFSPILDGFDTILDARNSSPAFTPASCLTRVLPCSHLCNEDNSMISVLPPALGS